jgi:hypothetical protein
MKVYNTSSVPIGGKMKSSMNLSAHRQLRICSLAAVCRVRSSASSGRLMTPAAGWRGASMSIHMYQHRRSLVRRSSGTMAKLSARLVARPMVLLDSKISFPHPKSSPSGQWHVLYGPVEAQPIRPVERPGCPHLYLPEVVALVE